MSCHCSGACHRLGYCPSMGCPPAYYFQPQVYYAKQNSLPMYPHPSQLPEANKRRNLFRYGRKRRPLK